MPTTESNTGLTLEKFLPRPTLVTQQTQVLRPKFPVIDAHNHLGCLMPGMQTSGGWAQRPVRELLDLMDEAGVTAMVDLDGQWGDTLKREIARYQEPNPKRFAVFNGMDYAAFEHRDFGTRLAKNLRDAVAAGAKGLKVWKLLGLSTKDPDGRLIAVNDRRLDELWSAAAEADVPVLIHVADPVAFFSPLDHANERYEELSGHPDWHFPSPPFPGFMTIMEQMADVFERHPNTKFIAAHVGCYAENLKWVGDLIKRCPNVYVDISARLAELGRQPYAAREFFIEHADRILFGTDISPNLAVYRLHYRFLETRDEYFSYWIEERPPQGRWAIYGMYLPDDVLKKVYAGNAAKLLKL